MSDGLLAALLAAALFLACVLGEALRPRVAWIPMALLVAALFAGALELARYDHGHARLLTWVGWVGAPVGAILGGAAWGTRRFYGWPDLGPHPSRVGLASAAVLLGVLVGSSVKRADVEESQARGEALRTAVLAWQAAHGGALPATLDEAAPRAPRTRMGGFDPPSFTLDAAGKAITFPITSHALLRLDLERGTWLRTERRPGGGG